MVLLFGIFLEQTVSWVQTTPCDVCESWGELRKLTFIFLILVFSSILLEEKSFACSSLFAIGCSDSYYTNVPCGSTLGWSWCGTCYNAPHLKDNGIDIDKIPVIKRQ